MVTCKADGGREGVGCWELSRLGLTGMKDMRGKESVRGSLECVFEVVRVCVKGVLQNTLIESINQCIIIIIIITFGREMYVMCPLQLLVIKYR